VGRGYARLEGRKGEVVEPDSHNQGVSQSVNDLIDNTLWGVAAEEGGFLCECGGSSCTAVVVMAPAEDVRLRDRGELVYAPDHGDAIP
jgi:hypothetical protein